MDFSLSSSLVGSVVSNPNKLALDLQFATDKTLTARKGPTPAFTRGSSATFVGSNGLIQSAGNNIARFDHDPVTLACKGLLIEESRTNACFNSNLLTSDSWIPTNSTVAADAAGPDGATAYEVSETTNISNHLLGNSGGATSTLATSVVSGTNYTGSIFFKKVVDSIDWIQLSLGSSGFGTVQYANFNIGNGTIGNSAGLASGTSPQIQDYGNGWYRCSITVTASNSSTTSANVIVFLINNINVVTRGPIYAGNTANKVIAAMGQLEAGAFPTSYIPTATASVIRSADVCSILSATSVINNLQGTIEANFSTNTGVYPIFSSPLTIRDSTGANGVSIEIVQASATTFNQRFRIYVGGVQTQTNMTGTFPILTTCKIAVGYEPSNSIGAKNSVLTATNTSTLAFTLPLTQVLIGSPIATTSPLNGCISLIKIYRKRLTNAKLQTITV